MKIPLLTMIALAAALAAAQGSRQIVLQSGKGNLTMKANSVALAQSSATSRNLIFKGAVSLVSVKQGLDMKAENVRATLATNPATKEDEIAKGTAEGNVRLAKTVTGKKGTQTTTITSASADYLARSVDALVTMRQSVKIVSVNEAKRQNMVATGSRGTAVLTKAKKSEANGLLSATLTGSVRIEILDRSDPKGPKKIIATGNKLDIDNKSKPATLVLTGDVKFVGDQSPLGGTMQGIKWAEFKLNEQGEYQSFRARSS